jgi:hypothetical protein
MGPDGVMAYSLVGAVKALANGFTDYSLSATWAYAFSATILIALILKALWD